MAAPARLKNPYLLISAGAPLVLNVASGSQDNVRKATGLAAILAGGTWLVTDSAVAQNIALGTGAAWAIMKLL